MTARSRHLKRLGRLAAGDPLRVYCVGIGGVGVSGLATVARCLGHHVAGSDRRPSRSTLALAERGVEVSFNQNGDSVHGDLDIVICSAAIPLDHPELVRARQQGVPIVKYAEALGAVFGTREGIAVAGTHGKTTTSSITAFALRDCGADPSFVIGGEIPQLGGSAAFGQGPDMVVEACEYDRSFLRLRPATAIIINIEEDHFDCFPEGLDEIIETFIAFGVQIKSGGTLVAAADCPNTRRVVEAVRGARPDLKILRFGESEDAEVRAVDVSFEDGRARFTVVAEGLCVGRVSLGSPGRHLVQNALAALTAASRTGLSWKRAIAAISRFEGVNRRFTVLNDTDDLVVIDDYAHHPTAIRAVLGAARARYPERRLVAIFEAHQHNRTLRLFDDFVDALREADNVVLTDIYRCRDADTDVEAVDASKLAGAIRERDGSVGVTHASGHDDVIHALGDMRRSGDVLMFMGAGRITELAHRVVAEQKAAPRERLACAARARPRRAESRIVTARPGGVARILERELGPILSRGESLDRHVTFRAGGSAEYFLRPKSVEDLVEVVKLTRRLGLPFHVLGGGSNSLFGDGRVSGAVIATRGIDAMRSIPDGLYAECGVLLQKVLHRCEKSGFGGLEDLAGIPATMGGAIAMNAGGPPDGPAVGTHVVRLMLLEADGRVRWLDGRQAGFRYRGSELADQVVLAAELGHFRPMRPLEIHERRFAAARRKAEVQPLATASAGCIFRNPTGASAGRLIDEAGLKGLRVGGAEVSDHHGNFIVNRGGATARDILTLVEQVRSTVEERTGHKLELELQVRA